MQNFEHKIKLRYVLPIHCHHRNNLNLELSVKRFLITPNTTVNQVFEKNILTNALNNQTRNLN